MAKNIPISSVDDLRTDLDSKVARKHIYADIAAMILASAQADQKEGEFMRVTDASADSNVITGSAYYDYKGISNETLSDYFLVITSTGSDFADHVSGDGSDHENVTLNDTHRLGGGSDHAKVAENSAKNSYPPDDAAKLLTIAEYAQVNVPPVHVADYADMADMISKQSEQIIGHPYKTLDDENWQYLKVKTGNASDYDGGGDIEEPIVISMSDYETDVEVGAGKGYWLAPWACTIQSAIGGLVVEAPVGATAIFDLNKNGTTMMTTNKIQIESGNKHSINSTTQPAFTTTAIAKGDIISGDIDTPGDTTKGKGAQIVFTVTR